MKSRYAASISVALLVAFGASGCAFITPQATVSIKEVSDGVEGSVGSDLVVRNATLISDDGKTGNLIVSLINSSEGAITVSMSYATASGSTETLTQYVEGSQAVHLGGEGDVKATFTDLDVTAGSLFKVFFTYGDATGTELLVPVLSSDWAQFESVAPTVAPTTTSTPVPTSGAGSTETPAPTPTSTP